MAEAKHTRIHKPLHKAFHPKMYKWLNKEFIITILILKVKANNTYRKENTCPKRPVAELGIQGARKYKSQILLPCFVQKYAVHP